VPDRLALLVTVTLAVASLVSAAAELSTRLLAVQVPHSVVPLTSAILTAPAELNPNEPKFSATAGVVVFRSIDVPDSAALPVTARDRKSVVEGARAVLSTRLLAVHNPHSVVPLDSPIFTATAELNVTVPKF